ncbi:MAG: putative lipid II flippase FtsW [Patescibacteria group bacterium]|nr:putative lipid II flippase FtsW [Candidatus Beckwithbacteria bacterium]MDZ4228776.1 putative lipid II flippase FtsW [Patescibacteria group bacterium]
MGKKTLKSFDLVLLTLVVVVSLFGLIMVYNASVVEADALFADKYYFLKQQALWLVIGLASLVAAAYFPLSWVKKISPILLLVTLLSLVLVLIPGLGTEALGARRWLALGDFRLQPTELAKLSLLVYLAAWWERPRPFWQFLVILALFFGLIMLQPDLGTALVVLAAAFLLFYIAGGQLKWLVTLGFLGTAAGLGLIYSSHYRQERLMTFLNPLRDPLGSSYHIRQALIAIGSGGFWGLGLGESRQKYQYLPQVTTDSIFAIVAEEAGFIGASLLILVLLLIIWRGLKIARLAPDRFTSLLAAGMTSWIGIQIFVNLAAMLALVPLTGVPLPFISYGGSSLIVTLTAVGLLLNISRFRVNPKKRS